MEWLKKHRVPVALLMAAAGLLVTVSAIDLISNRSGRSAARDPRLRSLQITEPSGSFRLWVNSFPEGALVLIDDSAYGVTPLALDCLESGGHGLGLRLGGFADVDTFFSMPHDGSLALSPFIFPKHVVLESVPPDAEITINGRETKNRTPHQLRWPITDTFNVRYSLAGLEPIGLSGIDLMAGTQISPVSQYWVVTHDSASSSVGFTGYFQKEITINTTPGSVEIIAAADGRAIGCSGVPVRMQCGSWDLTLRKRGFNERRINIEISADSRLSYDFELTRSIRITAFCLDGSPDIDIGARVVKADRGVRVTFLDERTPALVTLPGAEHRIYFQADDCIDTFAVVSADQTELVIGMRRTSGPVAGAAVGARVEQIPKARAEFYVHDKKSKKALAGVEVIAKMESDGRTVLLGVTGSAGLLEIDLPADKYEFRFVASGYKSSREKQTMKPGETRRFDVSMKAR